MSAMSTAFSAMQDRHEIQALKQQVEMIRSSSEQPRYSARQEKGQRRPELLSETSALPTTVESHDQTNFLDMSRDATQDIEPLASHAPATPQPSWPPNHDSKPGDNGTTMAANCGLSEDTEQAVIDAQSGRTIESVSLDQDQVRHLFNIYFTHYYPYLPVVAPPSSADTVYDISPLLFWSIIMVAARHDEGDLSLFQSLSPSVRTMMWQTIATPPYILPSLQAICILCAWPFSASSLTHDITFMLGGLLKTAALQAGLHQPDAYTYFSRSRYALSPTELCLAARVWCCIYITIERYEDTSAISHALSIPLVPDGLSPSTLLRLFSDQGTLTWWPSLAVMTGHVPYIPGDRTIELAATSSNPYSFPTRLHEAVQLRIFCNKVHAAMGELDRLETSASRPTRAFTLRLLEADLQELQRKFVSPKSDRTKVELLSAIFQFRGYWLLEPHESSARRTGILRAYEDAIELVTAIKNGEQTDNHVKYSTGSTHAMLLACGVYLSTVIHSAYKQYVDVDHGKQVFNTCILLLKQCRVEDSDIPGRGSRVLGELWGIHRSSVVRNERPPSLKVASRMVFSLVHDALWLWREKYAGHPANGAPPLPPPFIPTPNSVPDSASQRVGSEDVSTTQPQNDRTVEQPARTPGELFNSDVFLHNLADIGGIGDDLSWDIGFFNANATQYNIQPPDFAMPVAETPW